MYSASYFILDLWNHGNKENVLTGDTGPPGGYYNQQQYPTQGYQQQGYGPQYGPQGYYGPQQGGYYDNRNGAGMGTGLLAGLAACCCLEACCLF